MAERVLIKFLFSI